MKEENKMFEYKNGNTKVEDLRLKLKQKNQQDTNLGQESKDKHGKIVHHDEDKDKYNKTSGENGNRKKHLVTGSLATLQKEYESDSRESSFDEEEYKTITYLVERYGKKKKKKKKKKQRVDFSDEDSDSSKKIKKRKRKRSISDDDENITKKMKHFKCNLLKTNNSNKTVDSNLDSNYSVKHAKNKKLKKEKKKKKWQEKNLDESSSENDTSDIEEELRKIQERKKELIAREEKEKKGISAMKTDLLKYVCHPYCEDTKPSSYTYLSEEAEVALEKAENKFRIETENKIKPKKLERRRSDSCEKVTNLKNEKHVRTIRYIDLENNHEIKKCDEENKIRHRIMNNIRNRIAKFKTESSDGSNFNNQIRNEAPEKRSYELFSGSHSSTNRNHKEDCRSSIKTVSNSGEHKHSEHKSQTSEAYRSSRRSQTFEDRRSKNYPNENNEYRYRRDTETSLPQTKSYSESLDRFISEKKRQIFKNKEVRENLLCCNFCGIANHTYATCDKNEANGRNPCDASGKKIECGQCGSFDHFIDTCIHTEAKGSNPYGFDGKKFQCGHCGSYDHKTNKCKRIHSERFGRNPMGISGKKIACDKCNSFDHFGSNCSGLASGIISGKHEPSCDHCGSFSHRSKYCKEIPAVFQREEKTSVNTNILSINNMVENFTPKEEFDGFYKLPVEVALGNCKWCASTIHCHRTCPVKHKREFGRNPTNDYGVMMQCLQCWSYSHMIDVCFHSKEKGKNIVNQNGEKISCICCGSYNHTFSCKDRDLEKNGQNPKDANGVKQRCEYCGSYNHNEHFCNHTRKLGRNVKLPNGCKKRCPYCGSYDHYMEKACMALNDQTREFLREQIGFEKLKVCDTAPKGVLQTTAPIVVDLDEEVAANQRNSRWSNFRSIVLSSNIKYNGCEISQEEKNEQMDAERKMKERLMAKFQQIDPQFFGSQSEKTKDEGLAELDQHDNCNMELDDSTGEIIEKVEYDEPDASVFEDVDLRSKTDIYFRITTSMHNEIVSAIQSERENIISAHKINITKRDLFGLTGKNWMNDKVMEFYLQMVATRSLSTDYRDLRMPKIHCMSTYFFLNLIMRGYEALERWTKDIDIFQYDILLVPIHLDMHWCLAIIDFRSPGVFYYDSMGGHNMPALSALLEYLRQEHQTKKGYDLDLRHFAKEIVADCPQQDNGSDCGVFVCKVAEFISRETSLTFSQEDMAYYRKRMIWEIANNQLISP